MLTTASLVFSTVALLLNSQAPQAECLTRYGQTQCGYDCVAAYGQLRCAPSPGGACLAAYGQIECSGPSGLPPYAEVPQAQCVAAYGQVMCGYGCVQGYGQVRCSTVPGGMCTAAYGQLTCMEPPYRGRHGHGPHHGHLAQQGWAPVAAPPPAAPGVPQAQCLSRYGVTACGYDCMARFGEVRCAQTPYGRCMARNSTIQCWDPR